MLDWVSKLFSFVGSAFQAVFDFFSGLDSFFANFMPGNPILMFGFIGFGFLLLFLRLFNRIIEGIKFW